MWKTLFIMFLSVAVSDATLCDGKWIPGPCSVSCGIGTRLETYSIFSGTCTDADGDTRTAACNTQSCTVTSQTCADVSFAVCYGLEKVRVSAPGTVVCSGEGCITTCCIPPATAPSTDDAAVTVGLTKVETIVATTTLVESSDKKTAVAFVNVDEPLPPITIGNSTVVVDTYGDGVASCKMIVEDPAVAANRLGLQLPTEKSYAVAVSFERFDKQGNSFNHVPMTWYQGSETEDLQVFIIKNGKLIDLRAYPNVNLPYGQKGRVTPVEPLDKAQFPYWFECYTPSTSSFVGAVLTPAYCADYTCAYGFKIQNSDPCLQGLCDDSQCCDHSCALHECRTGTKKDLAANIICEGNCDDVTCCVGGTNCGDGKVDVNRGEQCEPPNKGCCNKDCKFKPKGSPCRTLTKQCQRQPTCTGFSGKCPKTVIIPDGTVCDPGYLTPSTDKYFCLQGHCKKSRWCGNNKVERNEDCEPPGVGCCDHHCHFQPSSVTCRESTGPCDVKDYCSGRHGECGLDFKKPNGATCFNATTNQVGMCLHGTCGDAMDYHSSHSSSSSSSSHHH